MCRHTDFMCHLEVKVSPWFIWIPNINLRKLTEAEILHTCIVVPHAYRSRSALNRYINLLPKCKMTPEWSLIVVPRFYFWSEFKEAIILLYLKKYPFQTHMSFCWFYRYQYLLVELQAIIYKWPRHLRNVAIDKFKQDKTINYYINDFLIQFVR